MLAKRVYVLYTRNMSITERQKQIFEFIGTFQEREGFPPSLREICNALGLVSTGSLMKHIQSLESEGLIKGAQGRKRAWKIVNPADRKAPSIPIVGQIAAGQPILAQENKEEELPINPSFFGSTDAFALRVKGDSMIEAHIQDGDLAIIHPQQDSENGSIVAVIVEDIEPEATLKIFRIDDDRIELRPANQSYEPLIFKGKDRSKIKVLGKLVGVIRTKP
ncbi:MAG: transcriptional repressor LexA [Deltaproteobacteria bacterium]|nr:transcriptional repressor LexA [Deltaproteobacteria bacterium]